MNTPPSKPRRGEVWYADLDPVVGHEQAGLRPVLIISDNLINQAPNDLVIAVPMTTRYRGVALHVPISPPEGGLREQSYIRCEDIRSLSHKRLRRRLGAAGGQTMASVEKALRIMLDL